MPQSKQISLTAAFIAVKFYGLMQIPKYRALFPDEVINFYDKTTALLPQPLNRFHYLLQKKPVRKGLLYLEEFMLPGDLMHILQRKWMTHYLWQNSGLDEFQQVLVLGAGFDHLAAFTSQRGIPSLEIDRNATSVIKNKILNKSGRMNPHLTLENSGFCDSRLSTHLQALSAQKNTLILTEGFWDYQTRADNQQIIDQICTFFRGKITLVSTIFDINKLNTFHRSVFINSIRTTGEQIKFISSEDNLVKLLNDSGFMLDKNYKPYKISHLMNLVNNTNLKNLSGFSIAIYKKN